MALTSVFFPLFVCILLLLYYAAAHRWQWILLLLASYVFYILNGIENLAYILFTTLTTYAATQIMQRNHERFDSKTFKHKSRFWLFACLILNFGLLTVCKLRFTFDNILLPLGISYYLFRSTGYVLDIYRGAAEAERNPFKLALFVSLFPCLVQGPISKFNQLAPQLLAGHSYEAKQVSFGFQRMLWGYFKKMVIADRIAAAVAVLRGPAYTGTAFLLLTVCYAVQIYADFTGGMDIVNGLSQSFGIRLQENFQHPFFSKSIAQYWRRWHISLGEWMKEYIFFPICVSSSMRRLSQTARKKLGGFGKRLPVYVATVITWFATGIWHGLTPNFIVWGMMNCLVIISSEELSPLYAQFHKRFRWKETHWYGLWEILRTFTLMNLIRIADLFPDVTEYFQKLGGMFKPFRISIQELGLTNSDLWILTLGILLMLAVSLFQEKKGSIREWLWEKQLLRYTLTFVLFLAILLFGCYGLEYDANNFIYNRF